MLASTSVVASGPACSCNASTRATVHGASACGATAGWGAAVGRAAAVGGGATVGCAATAGPAGAGAATESVSGPTQRSASATTTPSARSDSVTPSLLPALNW